MHATRAAVEEGILPGGGVALLRAGKAIEKLRAKTRTSSIFCFEIRSRDDIAWLIDSRSSGRAP
jgi:chaperonin GroEL (HSP60 family)